MMKSRHTLLAGLIVFLACAGCIQPELPRNWMATLPDPAVSSRTTPVCVAVVVNDKRAPTGNNPEFGLLALVPLVPYAQGTACGTPELVSGPPSGPWTSGIMDYKQTIALLLAKGLRNSKTVIHAKCESPSAPLNQYEAVLELDMHKGKYTKGAFTYCLGPYGVFLWFIGLPAARIEAQIAFDWNLRLTSTDEILASGTYANGFNKIWGVYYNRGGATVPKATERLHTTFYPEMVESVVQQAQKALLAKSDSQWRAIAKAHETWREANGERLAYRRTQQPPLRPTPPVTPPVTQVTTQSRTWARRGTQQAWVLVVGIQNYKARNVAALPYAKRDAESVQRWFTRRAGLPKANVHALLNEQATRKNLLAEIDWLRRSAVGKDAVFIYFACHGAPELATDGSGYDGKYLVLHDTDPARLFATGFPLDDLTRKMDSIPARTQVVILESCYAGPVGKEILRKAPTADLVIQPKTIREMGEKTGRVILTASSGRQVALGSAEFEGGVFTHYLLAAWGDGKKRLLTTCFDDVQDKVLRKANKEGSTQEPQKYGDMNMDIGLTE